MPSAPSRTVLRRTVRPARRRPVRIGFVAVSDCAPLLVARELGFFASEGIEVTLTCEVGWATTRDRLLNREIDAALAMAGMVLSVRLGLGVPASDVRTGFVLSLHGNAITLSHDLWRRGVGDARGLRKLIRSTPQRLLTFGVGARESANHFLLRRWLAFGGINPARDVRILVLPPTQLARSLKAGLIDGFCVNEPWNSVSIAERAGWCVATSEEIAPGHPEKVLAVNGKFATTRGAEHAALLRALGEACVFCDRPDNRLQVVEILRASGIFGEAAEVLDRSLIGPFDMGHGPVREAANFHVFHRQRANVPSVAGREWLLAEFSAHVLEAEQGPEARVALESGWQPNLYRTAFSRGGVSSRLHS
jgi:ABC-type nitrate/sulfonate/bicarbonate transport system substrate-binding protein